MMAVDPAGVALIGEYNDDDDGTEGCTGITWVVAGSAGMRLLFVCSWSAVLNNNDGDPCKTASLPSMTSAVATVLVTMLVVVLLLLLVVSVAGDATSTALSRCPAASLDDDDESDGEMTSVALGTTTVESNPSSAFDNNSIVFVFSALFL